MPTRRKKQVTFIGRTLGTITKKVRSATPRVKTGYRKTVIYIQQKPFISFFIGLFILLLIIILGSTLFKVKAPEPEKKLQAKGVNIYRIGKSPRISVQGQVIKKGVIKIVAQTPGIVSQINAKDGSQVRRGQTLINLASNYQGGNAFSLQRQLAALQYKNTKDNFDGQKSLIQRQRDLANTQSNNTDELKKLTQTSIDETQSLVDLNNTIIATLRGNLENLQNSNGDPQAILSLQQLLAQVQGGTNQLQAGLRANQYQVADNKPPTELAKITKDITIKQLDLQEKALNLGLESTKLQLQLAQVQEAMMYPAAPFSGTVQKVNVKVGEAVNPGTILATLAGTDTTVLVDVKIPQHIALNLSKIEPSIIEVGGKKLKVMPSYVSTEATSGQLYSAIFSIDEKDSDLFTDSGYVSVSLPIGLAASTATVPFIPVDSVFQTQDEAFVFVVNGNKAQSKKIILGEVTGKYVAVEKGLSQNDQIILNRNIVDNDEIKIEN